MATRPRNRAPVRARSRHRAPAPPAAPANDFALDAEISAAVVADRPVNMSEAFPEPPRPEDDDPPEAPSGMPRAHVSPPLQAPPAQVSGAEGGYLREYELRLLHRLLLNDIRLDQIARRMNKSITEVQRLRRALFRRIRHEAANVDMVTHAGQTKAFYNLVRGMALRMASDEAKPLVSRVRALEVSLNAENDKHKFLNLAGFYSGAKYLPKAEDSDDDGNAREGVLSRLARAMYDPTVDEEEMERVCLQIANEDSGGMDVESADQDTNIL